MEHVQRKDRWGITLLIFFIVSGLFSFLIYRSLNSGRSEKYVYSEVPGLDNLAQKKDILYNYHSVSDEDVNIIDREQEIKKEEKPEEKKAGEDEGKKNFIYHKVASGETLWKIADRYKVPILTLIEQNNIENPDLIFSGDILKVQIAL